MIQYFISMLLLLSVRAFLPQIGRKINKITILDLSRNEVERVGWNLTNTASVSLLASLCIAMLYSQNVEIYHLKEEVVVILETIQYLFHIFFEPIYSGCFVEVPNSF